MAQLQVMRQRIDGIEDMRRVLGEPHVNCVPLGIDTPTGAIFRASIGDVFLRAGELSADIRTRSSVESDLLSFSVKLESSGSLFSFRSGDEVLPGDVYRLARGDVSDYRLSGHMRFAFISLRPDLLSRHGAEDALQGDRSVWEHRQWFRAPYAMRIVVARSVQRIASQVLHLDWAVTGQALRQLQADLIEPLVWGITSGEPRSSERYALSAATIVRRVEDWVDGQPPAAIQIADLCRALHLSRRTLHRAFAETLAMGPARYLTLKRLSAVRAELRRSDPAAINVTDIAIKYGFWELGRFAREYRHMFGERPSETLSKGTRYGVGV
jgi:AraC family ethanolamine operon transcriptional activator